MAILKITSTKASDSIVKTSLLLDDRQLWSWSDLPYMGHREAHDLEKVTASLLASFGLRSIVVSDVSEREVQVGLMVPPGTVIPKGHKDFYSMILLSQEALDTGVELNTGERIVEALVGMVGGMAARKNEVEGARNPEEITSRMSGSDVPNQDRPGKEDGVSLLSKARRRFRDIRSGRVSGGFAGGEDGDGGG